MTASRFIFAGIAALLTGAAASAWRQPATPQAAATGGQGGSIGGSGTGAGSAANGDSVQPSGEAAWLRSVLAMPGADSSIRLGAAQRLLRLATSDSPLAEQAESVLREGLRSNDETRVTAIVDAVRSAEPALRDRLSRSLVSALLDAARTTPGPRRDGLRAAFADLGESAVATLGAIAGDQQADEARRLTAVWALEAMSHISATEALVGLLDRRRAAIEPVRRAACDALERNFQRGFGQDEGRWREWWLREAGGRGDDSVLEGLRRRLLDVERRLSDQEQERTRLESRLASLYGEIYLALDPAQRQERTVRLLEDELPVVREYALGLVDRMLQNFESPGEPLQEAILGRIDPEREPRPAIRSRALALLESIRRPDFAERVTPFFVQESDPKVLGAYLTMFQQRPATSDAAFERLASLLERSGNDAALEEELARTIVRLGDVGALNEDRMARLRPIARTMENKLTTPAFVRLAGAVAEESRLDRVEALLTSPDRSLRRAAAEVMRQRGRRDTLAAHHADEAIYPVAIRAAADPPPSLESLRRILSWTPPTESASSDRAQVVAELATALPLSELLAADDLLLGEEWPTEAMRLEILSKAVKRASEVNGGATRSEGSTTVPPSVLIRLGNLLIGSDDPRRLQTVIDRLGNSHEDGAEELRFAAAILQQQYDLAEELRPDPAIWLDLLERLVARGSAAAAPLNDELDRRFRTDLTPEQSVRLQKAADSLRARPSVG